MKEWKVLYFTYLDMYACFKPVNHLPCLDVHDNAKLFF